MEKKEENNQHLKRTQRLSIDHLSHANLGLMARQQRSLQSPFLVPLAIEELHRLSEENVHEHVNGKLKR